jgi:hypothetical protein
MSNKKSSVHLDRQALEALRANGALAGTTASGMLDRLIDDKFGGQMLGGKNNISIQAILQHVDELERILRS